MKCCFCNKKIEGHGNNPAPAGMKANDRCCNDCNMKIVIPTRIAMMTGGRNVK